MNNQYAVSIRHIYTMPDETFDHDDNHRNDKSSKE